MTSLELLAVSFTAGVVLSTVTAPVGVSGAVFLMPVQISVLQIPSPAVTPTNLLFNIIAIPGALVRYSRRSSLRSALTVVMLAGTVPGVVIGAVVRVFLLPGAAVFQLFVAAILLPLGVWLCRRAWTKQTRVREGHPDSRARIALLSLVIGVVSGIYGIGGGSLLSPILVGRGLSVGIVAPAALTSTFVTSLAGAATYMLLAFSRPGLPIVPHWTVGIAAGIGGLLGGYLGAALQPRLPERALRFTLGILAIITAGFYIGESFR
ncbi:sulfite exporter TauE/SafE family protein [Mycobacterium sp. 236(2023)]|uniref:sulfite exporter TauE/SafE family protein n=1 Tax=Mycobacterium sp. 236(2023) TaxID=3038163 RepID=UPI0024158751|nr:sulfite exporter TauE/SafE family protein [Mycobacterium sp. 236(2023)]MDG4667593.1 sulfite exporter TauE/SafE family protein [Mycobacterium sp. 236(2023)]